MDPVTSQPLNIALSEFQIVSQPGEPHYSTQFFHFGENFLAVALPLSRMELFESVRTISPSLLALAIEGKAWIHDVLGLTDSGAIVWIQALPVRRGIPAGLARVNELQSFSAPARQNVATPAPEVETPELTEIPAKKSKSKGD
jgi:hypothetical protein